MKFNPLKHGRRSIRLKGYDYSKEGMYFITSCCAGMAHRFGKIMDGEMFLNEYGQIANDEWLKLTDQFRNIDLAEFVVMPNHMHGIIVINESTGATAASENVGAGFTSALGAKFTSALAIGFTPIHFKNKKKLPKKRAAFFLEQEQTLTVQGHR